MSEAADWSIRRLGEAYRQGETTPTAVATALLDRIAAQDGRLHAYAHVTPHRVMAQAAQAERELAEGLDRGPLHGVPIAVKDLCATADMPTRAGMPYVEPLFAGQDSTVVARLRQAGAIVAGKLQLTEGAVGQHHPDVPPPVNPWSPDYWPGVSSSGSGVAVAAGLCQAALGSDTGGSIRFPSACCGLTGLKPSAGRVSLAGVFPMAESMDTVGPMARSAEDAAHLLSAIAGPDPADPATELADPSDYAAALDGSLAGVALGVDEALISEDVDDAVAAAVLAASRVFAELGAAATPVSFPSLAEAAAARSVLEAEIGLAHEATFAAHAEAYGPRLRFLVDRAQQVSARDLVLARRSRLSLRRKVDTLLAKTPLALMPAMPIRVPTAEDGWAIPADAARLHRLNRFTIAFNFTGHPTVTLPCGFDDDGLPIGMQLVGRRMDEALLLRAADAFQRATDFHMRRPPA